MNGLLSYAGELSGVGPTAVMVIFLVGLLWSQHLPQITVLGTRWRDRTHLGRLERWSIVVAVAFAVLYCGAIALAWPRSTVAAVLIGALPPGVIGLTAIAGFGLSDLIKDPEKRRFRGWAFRVSSLLLGGIITLSQLPRHSPGTAPAGLITAVLAGLLFGFGGFCGIVFLVEVYRLPPSGLRRPRSRQSSLREGGSGRAD